MDTRLLPFEEYSTRFEHVKMQRDDRGILQLSLHTNGGSLQWGTPPHEELGKAFRFISADRDNRIVILTGTGDVFSGPRPTWETRGIKVRRDPDRWDITLWDGRQLEFALLDIEVPVIAAVNGPVYRHAELPLMSDIIIASDDAVFEDRSHVPCHLVPGDGIFVATSTLMGLNRARHFHLTGHSISAREAHQMGLIAEVVPKDEVLARAREIAEDLVKRPMLVLRYSRMIFTHKLKREMLDLLGYGLALEGLAAGADSSGLFPLPSTKP